MVRSEPNKQHQKHLFSFEKWGNCFEFFFRSFFFFWFLAVSLLHHIVQFNLKNGQSIDTLQRFQESTTSTMMQSTVVELNDIV